MKRKREVNLSPEQIQQGMVKLFKCGEIYIEWDKSLNKYAKEPGWYQNYWGKWVDENLFKTETKSIWEFNPDENHQWIEEERKAVKTFLPASEIKSRGALHQYIPGKVLRWEEIGISWISPLTMNLWNFKVAMKLETLKKIMLIQFYKMKILDFSNTHTANLFSEPLINLWSKIQRIIWEKFTYLQIDSPIKQWRVKIIQNCVKWEYLSAGKNTTIAAKREKKEKFINFEFPLLKKEMGLRMFI